jgi:hypothetical protein
MKLTAFTGMALALAWTFTPAMALTYAIVQNDTDSTIKVNGSDVAPKDSIFATLDAVIRGPIVGARRWAKVKDMHQKCTLSSGDSGWLIQAVEAKQGGGGSGTVDLCLEPGETIFNATLCINVTVQQKPNEFASVTMSQMPTTRCTG